MHDQAASRTVGDRDVVRDIVVVPLLVQIVYMHLVLGQSPISVLCYA